MSTTEHDARGDVSNEGKQFKPFPGKTEVEARSVFENCDLSCYEVLRYIMNSFCINVIKRATT
jgi:hypothetical protein